MRAITVTDTLGLFDDVVLMIVRGLISMDGAITDGFASGTDGFVRVVEDVVGWTLVFFVGALGGLVATIILIRARERAERLEPLLRFDEVEVDDSQIDAVAEAWAARSGRPWAAGLVADKLRLLARIERSRAHQDHSTRPHEPRRGEAAAGQREPRRRRRGGDDRLAGRWERRRIGRVGRRRRRGWW